MIKLPHKKWIKVFLLTLMAGVSISSLQAQEDSLKVADKHEFTVNQAIDYAFEHQNTILNAKIDEQVAVQKVRETLGAGLPQVSGSASLQDYLQIPTTLLPGEIFGQPAGTFIPVQFGVKYQSALSLDVQQLIFDGSFFVGLQAAKTYKELSVRNTQRSKIETAVAVTKAYYGVLVNNEKMLLLNANIDQLKTSLFQTTEMNKNGFSEKVDVDRLQVMYNNMVTEKENLVQMLALNLSMLKFQMGMPIAENLVLMDKIKDISLEADVSFNVDSVRENRVEYGLLRTQKKLNELDLKRYKSQFLPTLGAFGSLQRSYQNNGFAELYKMAFPSSIIGLKLSVPIFSGGQKRARINQAKLTIQKSENDMVQLKNSVDFEIENAQTSYKTSINSLHTQQANMNLAKEVLRVAKIKYEQGVGSSLEVTQAQTGLKESENNYINALYNITINRVNLDKALGNIKN